MEIFAEQFRPSLTPRGAALRLHTYSWVPLACHPPDGSTMPKGGAQKLSHELTAPIQDRQAPPKVLWYCNFCPR